MRVYTSPWVRDNLTSAEAQFLVGLRHMEPRSATLELLAAHPRGPFTARYVDGDGYRRVQDASILRAIERILSGEGLADD